MSWLTGKTLLLTREERDAQAWMEPLQSLGAGILNLPCIVCRPADDPGLSDALRAALTDAEWLVLTSRRGVEATADLLGGPLPERVRLAVVGQATAREALDRFGRVDLVPELQNGRALAQALANQLRRDGEAAIARVVIAAADRAERLLEAELEPLGSWVTRLDVYRTLPAPPTGERRRLNSSQVAAVILASPSAVQGLLNQVEVPPDLPLISIGPSTSRAIRTEGLCVAAEAPAPSLEGLLEVLREAPAPPAPPAPPTGEIPHEHPPR